MSESGDSGSRRVRRAGPRWRPRHIIALIVVAVMAAVIAITSVVIAQLGILPPTYLWVVIGADILLGALVTLVLLTVGRHGHTVRYGVSLGLALVLIAGNLIALKVGSDYAHFTEVLQPTTESVQYDIVARTDGPASLAAIIGAEVPADSTDELYQGVITHVKEIVSVVVVGLVGQQSLVDAVVNGDSKAAIIQETYLQDVAEGDPTVYQQLKVLATFSVPVTDTGPGVTPPPTTTPTPPPDADAPYIVYISGIDVAGPIATRSRSDVNILMVVNPHTGQILLVTTPRDFYVQLAGIDTPLKDKLTHAGVYGIDTSIGTMNNLYDISIDYYLRINFSSLVQVVDTLGGVDVNSAYDFSAAGYTFHQGINHLDGAAALAFSRDRHSFATGDRVRGQNQEAVITAIIARLTDPSVLARYDQIMTAVAGAVQTSMPPQTISAQVQRQLANGTKWAVTSISVNGADGSEYTYSYPHQKLYVMIPDQATVDAAKAQIQATLAGT